ncbi:uncharacterized protein [Choristoneura fumiferana]|uniref:uncharacterized protein n=1 Tax=Choristoneura fumiferana TaxID=7141 RepID=UPI003D154779
MDDAIGLEVIVPPCSSERAQPTDDTNNGTTPPEHTSVEPPEPTVAASITSPSDPVSAQVPELDPELLSALGEATEDSPKLGPKIHENLSQRWLPLLRKGLAKDTKEKLLKDYLIPENCTLLQAPKLNAEISAAVTEMARNRDKKMETGQQQLGIGITAINRAMTILLNSDDKISAIKSLSDSCRILSDLHFSETQARIKLITPGLAKPFLTVIQDTERDDMLFGNKLQEKIKASKAIEKQGLQIKKPLANGKNTTAPTPSTGPRTNYQQYQGNWTGPSRYPSNRGGRGGQRKAVMTARKPQAQPQSRPAGQAKPRASTQQ